MAPDTADQEILIVPEPQELEAVAVRPDGVAGTAAFTVTVTDPDDVLAKMLVPHARDRTTAKTKRGRTIFIIQLLYNFRKRRDKSAEMQTVHKCPQKYLRYMGRVVI